VPLGSSFGVLDDGMCSDLCDCSRGCASVSPLVRSLIAKDELSLFALSCTSMARLDSQTSEVPTPVLLALSSSKLGKTEGPRLLENKSNSWCPHAHISMLHRLTLFHAIFLLLCDHSS
jgi:hypothetical protein